MHDTVCYYYSTHTHTISIVMLCVIVRKLHCPRQWAFQHDSFRDIPCVCVCERALLCLLHMQSDWVTTPQLICIAMNFVYWHLVHSGHCQYNTFLICSPHFPQYTKIRNCVMERPFSHAFHPLNVAMTLIQVHWFLVVHQKRSSFIKWLNYKVNKAFRCRRCRRCHCCLCILVFLVRLFGRMAWWNFLEKDKGLFVTIFIVKPTKITLKTKSEEKKPLTFIFVLCKVFAPKTHSTAIAEL